MQMSEKNFLFYPVLENVDNLLMNERLGPWYAESNSYDLSLSAFAVKCLS